MQVRGPGLPEGGKAGIGVEIVHARKIRVDRMPPLKGKAPKAVGPSAPDDRGLQPSPAPRYANPQADALLLPPVMILQRLKQHIADGGKMVNVLMTVGERRRASKSLLESLELPVRLPSKLRSV